MVNLLSSNSPFAQVLSFHFSQRQKAMTFNSLLVNSKSSSILPYASAVPACSFRILIPFTFRKNKNTHLLSDVVKHKLLYVLLIYISVLICMTELSRKFWSGGPKFLENWSAGPLFSENFGPHVELWSKLKYFGVSTFNDTCLCQSVR